LGLNHKIVPFDFPERNLANVADEFGTLRKNQQRSTKKARRLLQ
jgi:hypothetical protein